MASTRKKNKTDSCKQCGKEFSHYRYDSQEYCSQGCAFQARRDIRPIVICLVCRKEMITFNSIVNRNEHHYCSRECYNNRSGDNKKQIKRGTAYMQRLIHASICGCGESKDYLLEIHHIDGDDTNNKDDNIEIVCSNCHMKRHLKLNKNGIWVYHPKSLTDRSLLNSL